MLRSWRELGGVSGVDMEGRGVGEPAVCLCESAL